MRTLQLEECTYTTKERVITPVARMLPSLHFYSRFICTVLRYGIVAQQGQFDDEKWAESSHRVLSYFEDIGVQIKITGMENVLDMKEPSVIIGNHMTFMETLILPAIILPNPVTFVVKDALLRYPVFKHILGSRNPIAVSRTNPRQDLKTVMDEGVKRLHSGMSVIVFPQSTRSHRFSSEQMNSIGVKLAKRADVPVVPMALKTDALQNGSLIKDFGKIDTAIPVRFAFGKPFRIEGKGGKEQELVNSFIGDKLREWCGESE